MTDEQYWNALMSLVQFQGSAGFDDKNPHFHLGITLQSPTRKTFDKASNLIAANHLNIMVSGKTAEDKWNCLCNFEEVRMVADYCFALTTDSMGSRGKRSELPDSFSNIYYLANFIEMLTGE